MYFGVAYTLLYNKDGASRKTGCTVVFIGIYLLSVQIIPGPDPIAALQGGDSCCSATVHSP